jgi:hypothetical protein
MDKNVIVISRNLKCVKNKTVIAVILKNTTPEE